MKKTLLIAAFGIMALQSVSAQETEQVADTVSVAKKESTHFYIGAGAEYVDFKLNDKLKASNLPEINPGALEISLGINNTSDKMSSDLEWNTNYYSDRKTPGERVRLVATGLKWRPQYIISSSKSMLFSAGLDLSIVWQRVDIYTRGNVIDLNDLNPATHSGHISLHNNNFYLGPSASFGVFQNSNWPLRLTTGYEWNLSRASWKSDVAQVANTVKESGQGRFYAKVIWYL